MLDLAGVDAEAGRETEPAEPVADRDGKSHGTSGPVEHGQDAVTRRFHLAPTKALDEPVDHHLVIVEEVPPPAVPDLLDRARRPDNVGEHHRREAAIDVELVVTLPGEELLDLVDH